MRPPQWDQRFLSQDGTKQRSLALTLRVGECMTGAGGDGGPRGIFLLILKIHRIMINGWEICWLQSTCTSKHVPQSAMSYQEEKMITEQTLTYDKRLMDSSIRQTPDKDMSETN